MCSPPIDDLGIQRAGPRTLLIKMFNRLSIILALSTVSLLGLPASVSAGHSRFHRHSVRQNISPIVKRDAGSVEVPISDLQLLRTEITAFQGWMQSWISTANASDTATNIAQLKLEFQAFDGWMTAWLDSTVSPTPSSPPPLPSSVPITTSTTITSSEVVVPTPPAPTEESSTSVSTTAPLDTTTSSTNGAEFFQVPSNPSTATTLIPVVATTASSTALTTSPIASSSSVPDAPVSSPPETTSSTSQPSAPAIPPSSGSSTFDAQSSSNLAVYYGQSGATSQTSLAQMCQDSNVDIVILAFLTTYFGPGDYPSLNFGAGCGGSTPAMQAAGASGLLSCPAMASDIKTCQGLGKKVLLSLGGAQATTAFSGDSQASEFATKLWDLFGGGNGEEVDMRPFGDAVLDGFDVDNEDHSTAFYTTFVSSLRTTMKADTSKPYYISAAPQCPRPDASIPLTAMQSMDFVFVQFYNNGDCNIGQPGFAASLKAWSQDLSANGGKGPKLYIGAPGCSACAGSGYLGGDAMKGVIESAKQAGLGNLGGVMLWDGPEGKANVDGGSDYLSLVKGAMG
ncbi:MAG: hypothetical protein Q9222_003682 [Ikaeria aurantiellina]